MTTRLGRANLQAIEALERAAPSGKPVRTRPPWGGYVPDAAQQLLDQRAFEASSGIIAAGEKLTAPPGWLLFQDADSPTTAPLPLGGEGHTFGTDPGHTIMLMDRLSLLAGQVEENLAVTAKRGSTNGALFRFGSAAEWEEVEPDSTKIETDNTRAMQGCVYPLASTASGKRGIFVWTNGIGTNGNVWYYPDSAGKYAPLPFPSAAPYDLVTFQCRSLAAHNERLYALNTVENSTSFPQRLRWTIPSWTTVSADNWGAATNVGMGALDFTSFKGQGVMALPQGNRLVCYFEDGVAVVENTGNPSAPHRRRYITNQRGLLGDHCAIDIGGGVHFGIFTDGWFLFGEDDSWREVGLTQVDGVSVSKFISRFYGLLKADGNHRICLGYDPALRHIHIAFPSGLEPYNPNEYWVYDLRGDRVWPMSTQATFGGTNLAVHGPCAFAMYRQVEVAGPDWEDLDGAWTAQNNPWLAYAPDLGQLRLAHGTSQGVVWQHEPALYTRNGVVPQWSFTVNTDFGDPYVLKTLQHRRIEHDGTSPTNVLNWSIFDDRGAPWASGTAPLISTGTGRQVATISPHFTAAAMRIRMNGTHPVQILGWQDEVVPLDVVPDPIS